MRRRTMGSMSAVALGLCTAVTARDALVLGEVAGFFPSPPAMATTGDGATWVAWVSDQCFGALRIQRIGADGSLLAPGGLELDLPDDCNTFEALLAPCPDGSIVATAGPHAFPIHRFDAAGAPLWGDGVLVSPIATVGDLLPVPGGDILATWYESSTVRVARYDAAGSPVWAQPASVPASANMRIIALVGDGGDGACVFWDTPSTYTRSIWVARVSGAGEAVWDAPLNIVPTDGPPSFSGSSRHTDPVAISDGAGGAVLVWTFGAESTTTPVPLLMQIVNPDGSRAFEPEGRRIALQGSRQYDAVVVRDPSSGDLLVGWRDGGFDAQELRGQRMTLTGERQWGDEGVPVTPLGVGTVSHFDASWRDDTLSLVVSDDPSPGDPSVVVHRVDGSGTVGEPIAVTDAAPVGPVRSVPLDDATMICWMEDTAGGEVLAQRVCDGPCPVFADATGDGLVNVDDLVAVITSWGPCPGCPADVTGDDVVNVDDLVAVIVAWTR